MPSRFPSFRASAYTGVGIRYPPPPSAREVSARSGDGGRDSTHPTAGHMGSALQSTAGMLTGRRLLQREALSLRTSDRVTGVAIRYPPPPSAREVSARSVDGRRDSAHPTAGHMGPALQSTAGMLTGRVLYEMTGGRVHITPGGDDLRFLVVFPAGLCYNIPSNHGGTGAFFPVRLKARERL